MAKRADFEFEVSPKQGKVKEVSQKWMVFEDGALAERMQSDEFSYKYGLNRYNRRTAREDVPVAKVCQSEEEERLQIQRMQHLERQKLIADHDEEIARRVQNEEQQRKAIIQDSLERDREIAQLQQEQDTLRHAMAQLHVDTKRLEAEDSIIAAQFQTKELIEAEKQRVLMEMKDQELARSLQEKEHQRYIQKKAERALAKQRKTLRQEQQNIAGDYLRGGYIMEGQVRPPERLHRSQSESSSDPRLLRTDGRVEDLGDFSDFYINASDDMLPEEVRELQELQDEELARLLQDQEKKRGAHLDRDKLKAIEEKDAQIAHLIYKQQKLRLLKKQKQQQQHQNGDSDLGRSYSVPAHHTYADPSFPDPQHSQNVHNEVQEQYRSSSRHPPPYQPPPPVQYSQRSTHTHAIYDDDGAVEYSGRPLPDTPANVSPSRTRAVYSASRSSPTQEESAPRNTSLITEDPYVDLNDLQRPVQGQKRRSNSEKKNNCKQQ